MGSFKPNAFGLFDMHGNVAEWVQDCEGYYSEAPNDGSAAIVSTVCRRIHRGGAYYKYAEYERAAARDWSGPGARENSIGFRVARDIAKTP